MVDQWAPREGSGGSSFRPSLARVWKDRILPTIWLAVIGALFLVVAAVTYGPGALFGSRIYPIWTLCAGLGVVALVGFLVAVYVGPDKAVVDAANLDLTRVAVVPRTEYKVTKSELTYLEHLAEHRGIPVSQDPSPAQDSVTPSSGGTRTAGATSSSLH
jgi:hypothetical protein